MHRNALSSRAACSIPRQGAGTLPSFAFHFADAANPTGWITPFSAANPRTFNNYDPVNSGATNFTPNLNSHREQQPT